MKALLVASGGAVAAASVLMLGTGQAGAEIIDVTGKPYAQAVALLKAQGVRAYFGGAVGHDLPQAQCPVVDMVTSTGGYVRLRVDCTRPDDMPAGIIPGANGVTTLTPTPLPYRPPPPFPPPAAAPPAPLPFG